MAGPAPPCACPAQPQWTLRHLARRRRIGIGIGGSGTAVIYAGDGLALAPQTVEAASSASLVRGVRGQGTWHLGDAPGCIEARRRQAWTARPGAIEADDPAERQRRIRSASRSAKSPAAGARRRGEARSAYESRAPLRDARLREAAEWEGRKRRAAMRVRDRIRPVAGTGIRGGNRTRAAQQFRRPATPPPFPTPPLQDESPVWDLAASRLLCTVPAAPASQMSIPGAVPRRLCLSV